MAGYSQLRITGNEAGLIQEREEFLLPDDAYPVLVNAYVWRERILRKQGATLLGRLQRNIGTTDGSGAASGTIGPLPIQPGIASFVIGTQTFVDPGGASPVTLLYNGTGTGTLNRSTGAYSFTGLSNLNTAIQYFPGLPVMGIRIFEQSNSAINETIVFDQNYAYIFNSSTSAYQEFLTGKSGSPATWNASAATVAGTDFFFSTNYWISGTANSPFSSTNIKLFWVTNNTGSDGNLMDPVRITDGNQWENFNSGTWNQIDAGPTYLVNFLAMLPFRGRLVTFNTWEGPNNDGSSGLHYSNRIRWSTIGNPFIIYHNTTGPTDPSTGSWRDDIRGQGGFLDIPTSEDIVCVGFVRDNLIIYCERSTWQLRYTGRSIAPFQIEKVNSELGAESLFSAIQFDTTLAGIGDKGIVSCDSYKSERIDIKIPDFIYQFNNENNGLSRVQGLRDFPNRLAYWTCPISGYYDGKIPSSSRIFPNVRLVYNYENDSWATFTDTFTALGNYQAQSARNWLNTPIPWINCNFPWINFPIGSPQLLGGNQQGFVMVMNNAITNTASLFISNIAGNTTASTVITSPNHNLVTGQVIQISGIASTDPFVDLNGGIFAVVTGDAMGANPQNTLSLFLYNPATLEFSTPQLDSSGQVFQGSGLITLRENFKIQSKKFNFLDEGENIQLGYVDVLMSDTGAPNAGAISMNVYLDYDASNASNILPMNNSDANVPDPVFNSTIPTTAPSLSAIEGTKFWQRVYCATRASFLTLEYTFSNAQMAGIQQQLEVQIDAQILWIRKAGRMTSY
jgi:hypothetical protein